MLSEQINNLANSLGALAGGVEIKEWETLCGLRSNLRSLAEQVHQLEVHFVPAETEKGGEDAHTNN